MQLLGHVQNHPELDPGAVLRGSLADGLHGEVAAMNRENFIVRMHLEAVERFQDRGAWERLSEGDRETLLSALLARSASPSLAHFVRSLVGLDRTAAQAAFSRFLNDRSLAPQQIRFVEMVIDQLTARGVMDASALYEPPFSSLHAGGPDELFAGRANVINAVFQTLASLEPRVRAAAG
ncbi:type I restriction-modification enzyme R subunit C-terminal domain-containing protein [Thioalkalivibrio paradoxus]|uniref:EcoEI R protein C-terminal domain-containing protein n=1 Tax=Thioalkalivibrio paradoxus ARh 1 TaxID=713585 RepID=W0DMX5_9GAMM|nr:type I restriction-modification enzyme R subunit C-terminal domain-containing protein [Thioalkalivibrio paradoxus]AHE99944.1 hypothetical protein THITH_04685 [Thioalkalivibrio paradoxus ARh 1]